MKKTLSILAVLSFGLSCLAVTGCATSAPATRPAPQAPALPPFPFVGLDDIGYVPPPNDYVITTREAGPSIMAENLPSGSFTITAKSPDVVPRVILTMTDGGEQFTCNLTSTGMYPKYTITPGCDGAAQSIHASCVDRTICFPVFDCGCAVDKKKP